MAFFSKLSLPHYRPALFPTSSSKIFDFNNRLLGSNSQRDESPLMKLAKRGSGVDERIVKDAARYSTTIPAKMQLEIILDEPEFAQTITSPRSNSSF